MKASLAAFFSYGFRPFFLMGAAYAALAMLVWVGWFWVAGRAPFPLADDLPPHLWHAHEMLFGYALAVIGGFFLTAVPNWTGRAPVQGAPLALLAGAWLAGRIAVWSSGALPAAVVAALDLAFQPLLLAYLVQALAAGGIRKNFVFLPIGAALAAGNLLFHLDRLGLAPGLAATGHALALDTAVLLIAVVGGRIVPAFTTNALHRKGETRLPVRWPLLNEASIVLVLAVLVADLVDPGGLAPGAAAALAAVANGARLAGWRSLKTLDEPILWIIHAGFAWLVAGLALKAWALLGGQIPELAASHALAAGAIGSMTLGVMSRASLGHTGRALAAPPAIVGAYVLVNLAAAVRVAGLAWLPSWHVETVVVSGLLWSAAFLLFAVTFLPILVRPRPRPAG